MQGRTLCQILEGQAYCFDKMTSHFPIVLEQKTIVLQNTKQGATKILRGGGGQVSATGYMFKEKIITDGKLNYKYFSATRNIYKKFVL